MHYKEDRQCWVAGYPYLFLRESLKGTKEVAMKAILGTERTLGKNKSWGDVYKSQIQDMVDPGVARKVPECGNICNSGVLELHISDALIQLSILKYSFISDDL